MKLWNLIPGGKPGVLLVGFLGAGLLLTGCSHSVALNPAQGAGDVVLSPAPEQSSEWQTTEVLLFALVVVLLLMILTIVVSALRKPKGE